MRGDCIRRLPLVLLEMIFFRRYSKELKQSYRSLQYDVNNLGSRFSSHLLLELLVDSILIPCMAAFIVLRDIILILWEKFSVPQIESFSVSDKESEAEQIC